MRGTKQYFCLIAICFIFAASLCAAIAQEAVTPALSVQLDNSYVSKYVWRGLVLNPDPAYQPSVTVSHSNGLSFNVWGSADTTDVMDESGHLTEIDYTLNYTKNVNNLCLNGGLIHYTFPNTSYDSTSEVYAGVCLGGKFSPTLSVNYDFDLADGYYASLSSGYACNLPVSKKTETTMNLSAKLSYASANYNNLYFGINKPAFTDLLLSASVPFNLNDKFSLIPAVNYSMVVDNDLRDNVSKPDAFYGGVTLSYAF